jgi:hypothetical protein
VRAVRELALPHPLEQVEVLVDGRFAVRALLARALERSRARPDLLLV